MSNASDEFKPRSRLRNRVIRAFVLAGLPSVLLVAAGGFALDRLISKEIEVRGRETTREAARLIQDEQRRIDAALDALSQAAELDLLAAQVDAPDLRAFAFTAGQLAPTHGLDLLTLVAARGPHAGTLISSAHLPAAIGDDAPDVATKLLSQRSLRASFRTELAEGNPPRHVPALIGGRTLTLGGSPALFIFGGARLDGHRLAHVARAGQATFVLRGPPEVDMTVFPADADASQGQLFHRLTLPSPKGTDSGGKAHLRIFVDTRRLERAQQLVRWTALGLGFASLLAAFGFGAFLSRGLTEPIVELSEAAHDVGAGQLDITLAPRSDDEVGALVRIFNRMTTELSASRVQLARAERIAAWQQIARRVAHEIKNPLFPIQMSIETLRKSYQKQHPKLDEIVEESSQTVLEEVRALNRIVTEFSDFARLPPAKRAHVPVEALLNQVFSLYKDTASAHVSLTPISVEANVFVDQEQIGRALVNLVKNALEAVSEQGKVNLHAYLAPRRHRSGVWLEVTDDGPGMSEAVREEVFTPYFTTKSEGTGLGLAIVDRIVSENGGEIRIDTRPGTGTTVSLWLPCEPSPSAGSSLGPAA